MTNAVKGEVPLVLSDGRNLKLVLDMEAMVEAEAAYGKPLGKLMADASAGFLGAMGALLQGALSRHHPVSRGDALEILRMDMDAVADALGKATDAAFPKASAEGNAPPPKKRQAGKRSGRSGAKQG
jgi:hypothetical protein